MRRYLTIVGQYPLLWIVSIMIAMGAIITSMSPYFLTLGNLSNLLKQVSIVAILGAGQTVVILSAGIDLSVGSILALSAVTTGWMIESGYPPTVAALAGLCMGTLCGFINGIIIAKGRIPPFIATLGMMGIARGMALVMTKGVSYMVLTPLFDFIGSGDIAGVPVPIIIVLIVFLILFIVLKNTVFGRNIYAIGDNEEASKLAGINVKKHLIWIYSISGFSCSRRGNDNDRPPRLFAAQCRSRCGVARHRRYHHRRHEFHRRYRWRGDDLDWRHDNGHADQRPQYFRRIILLAAGFYRYYYCSRSMDG